MVLFHTWLAKLKVYDSAVSRSKLIAAHGWILLSVICGGGGGSLTRLRGGGGNRDTVAGRGV